MPNRFGQGRLLQLHLLLLVLLLPVCDGGGADNKDDSLRSLLLRRPAGRPAAGLGSAAVAPAAADRGDAARPAGTPG
jgi:hypothetical protein